MRWGLHVRDLWRTPPEALALLRQRFPFALDAAASPEAAVCDRYLTPEEDALTCSWAEAAGGTVERPAWAFCNPPYSSRGGGLLAWVAKAVEEAATGRLGVVLLVPPSTGTRYMHLVDHAGSEVILWPYRLDFLDPFTGAPATSNRGDSCCPVIPPGLAVGEPCRWHYAVPWEAASASLPKLQAVE